MHNLEIKKKLFSPFFQKCFFSRIFSFFKTKRLYYIAKTNYLEATILYNSEGIPYQQNDKMTFKNFNLINPHTNLEATIKIFVNHELGIYNAKNEPNL